MNAFSDIFQKLHYVLRQSYNRCTGNRDLRWIANKFLIFSLKNEFSIFWEQGNWKKIILSGKLLFYIFDISLADHVPLWVDYRWRNSTHRTQRMCYRTITYSWIGQLSVNYRRFTRLLNRMSESGPFRTHTRISSSSPRLPFQGYEKVDFVVMETTKSQQRLSLVNYAVSSVL